jgi:hypothetical protein
MLPHLRCRRHERHGWLLLQAWSCPRLVDWRVFAAWFGFAPGIKLIFGKRGSAATPSALRTFLQADEGKDNETNQKQTEDYTENDDQIA